MDLLAALLASRPRASLLLLGRDPAGLRREVRATACRILGDSRPDRLRHPDYHELDAAGPDCSTDTVRAWLGALDSKPFEGGRVLLALLNADALDDFAGSVLLKSVEEPPEHTTFLLAATNPARLLPTILSRVFRVYLPVSPAPDLAALLRARAFLTLLRLRPPSPPASLLAPEDLRGLLETALPLAESARELTVLLRHIHMLDAFVGSADVALSLWRTFVTQRIEAAA